MLRDYLLVPSITNENLEEQDKKPDKVYSQDDVSKLEAQIDKLKTQLEKEKAKQIMLYQIEILERYETNIAHAILKIKDKKLEQEEEKAK